MQVVGRPCELCLEKLRSERGAVGCEACDLAIHEACVVRPESYRGASRGKTQTRVTPCPRCGDDLRARKRREDRERDAISKRNEEAHREATSLAASPARTILEPGPVRLIALLIGVFCFILSQFMSR